MATNTNTKDFLTFPADPLNRHCPEGRTIGAAAKARIDEWFLADFGQAPTADDISEWMASRLEDMVMNHGKKLRDAANAEPVVAELTEEVA